MNKFIGIGRLTKDIELSRTQSGKAFARFTLAVNRRFKSNDEQGQDADFISCIVWDKRAETMYQHLRKGSLIGIEGRIQTGSYERDGQRVYTTDVIVDNFDFLESRKNNEQEQTGYYTQNQEHESEPMLHIDSDLPF